MTETKTPQLIFALSVARDMAEQEGSPADMLVFLFDQALKEARDKALRLCLRAPLGLHAGGAPIWLS